MFGERLSKLRKTKNISQYELADRLGFSRGQLANYEQGKREPDYNTLCKIASYFDVTVDYLIGHSDSPYFNKVEDSFTKDIEKGMLAKDLLNKYDFDIKDLTEDEIKGIIAYVKVARSMKQE